MNFKQWNNLFSQNDTTQQCASDPGSLIRALLENRFNSVSQPSPNPPIYFTSQNSPKTLLTAENKRQQEWSKKQKKKSRAYNLFIAPSGALKYTSLMLPDDDVELQVPSPRAATRTLFNSGDGCSPLEMDGFKTVCCSSRSSFRARKKKMMRGFGLILFIEIYYCIKSIRSIGSRKREVTGDAAIFSCMHFNVNKEYLEFILNF